MTITGNQAVVKMLQAYGVKHVFGLPGDTSMALYEAFREAGHEITHILTRDERSASFMADVYARVSHRPGVCEGPSGGGATYIIPGVAEANYSSTALIVLTTDIPLRDEGRNVLTEMDQESLFAGITKWHTKVKRADKIPEMMRRAFRIATAGRPGAVHIALPQDILNETLAEGDVYADEPCRVYPSYRCRADASSVARAAELLLAAKRPVLIAGGGAVISQAWTEITALAESLAMPVATSINGKGSIAEDHTLSIGVVGGNGGRAYANEMVREADLILFVGCKTDSVTTMNWTLPPLGGSQTIVQIDVDPAEIGNSYKTALGLVGDAKLVLGDLLQAVREKRGGGWPPFFARTSEIGTRSHDWWKEFVAQARSPAVPVKSQRIIQALQAALPPDYLIVADPGTMTPFTAAYFRSAAGRRVIIPRAFGGLGYAIPGVVGAQLARPEATAVGLVGDGSFAMAAGEIETIHRLGLPVILIQFNNGCFGWIKTLQHFQHNRHYYNVDFADTDPVAVARGFGLHALRIERAEDLEAAIQDAIARREATFIDVPTAPEYIDVPPVAKWEELAGK